MKSPRENGVTCPSALNSSAYGARALMSSWYHRIMSHAVPFGVVENGKDRSQRKA